MNSVIILRTNISVNLAELRTMRFKHTNSTLRGPNAYEDGKPEDTAHTFGAQSNPGYSESLKRDTRGVNNDKYEEDPGYATPDIVRKPPYVETNPIYASQADPRYETPDFKRKEMNTDPPSRSTFDAEDSEPNIKRVEVNGDLYSLPSKGTVKVKLLHLQIRLATKTVSSVTVKKI